MKFAEATGWSHEDGIYVWTGKEWKQDATKSWRDPGFKQTDRHPVVGVSWRDAQAYVEWLSQETGQVYRLPSEAEWEYACRAGTLTPFSFGKMITTDQANYDGNYTYAGGPKGEYRQQTVPVGTLPANPWGGACTRCTATSGSGRRTSGTTLHGCSDRWLGVDSWRRKKVLSRSRRPWRLLGQPSEEPPFGHPGLGPSRYSAQQSGLPGGRDASSGLDHCELAKRVRQSRIDKALRPRHP